jgi:bacteriophage N4 adsorption protein B
VDTYYVSSLIAVFVDTAIFFLALSYLWLSLDDFLLDCFFYARGIWRKIRGLDRNPLTVEELAKKSEARIAVFIPCWHEAEVVEHMLSLALQKITYKRYEIFVGVYPNDPQTQARVDAICARTTQVRKVVNPTLGPTTKAQNLNSMFARMREVEGDDPFEIVVLHDVEDVIHPLSLKLYNKFMPGNDMVQIPVFPLPRAMRRFTSWTYADEFAENHMKDMVVREAIGAFVTCAGVGCAFNRSALEVLGRLRNGTIFRDTALTEDYQLSLDMKLHGFKTAFVKEIPLGADAHIATRAYFPDDIRAAIRQKTRWVTGICLQAWQMQGWKGSMAVRYALYRDRKGMLGHFACVLGYPVMFLAFALSAWHSSDPHVVVAVFRHTAIIFDSLCSVIALAVWRIAQRAVQVGRIYGSRAALFSILRFPWGNLINGCAVFSAVYIYMLAMIRREPLRWAKTKHVFPVDAVESRPARHDQSLDLEGVA